jgi:hypothetical protein
MSNRWRMMRPADGSNSRSQPGRSLPVSVSAGGSVFDRPYSVTPGSLTLWSVQVLRRIYRSTAAVRTSNAAIEPNVLAFNRRFPIDRR